MTSSVTANGSDVENAPQATGSVIQTDVPPALPTEEDADLIGAAGLYDSKLAFLVHVHQYLSDNIRFSDQKAAFVFAFDIGIVSLANTLHVYDHLNLGLYSWAIGNKFPAIATALLVLSAGASLGALLPRLRAHASDGLIYFVHINSHSSVTEYGARIMHAKESDILSELSSHSFTLANIATRKFIWIKYALWLGCLGTAVILGALAQSSNFPHPTSSQRALENIDHAASAVVSALEMHMEPKEIKVRSAALGAELRTVNKAGWTADNVRILSAYQDSYQALIRLDTASAPSTQKIVETKNAPPKSGRAIKHPASPKLLQQPDREALERGALASLESAHQKLEAASHD